MIEKAITEAQKITLLFIVIQIIFMQCYSDSQKQSQQP